MAQAKRQPPVAQPSPLAPAPVGDLISLDTWEDALKMGKPARVGSPTSLVDDLHAGDWAVWEPLPTPPQASAGWDMKKAAVLSQFGQAPQSQMQPPLGAYPSAGFGSATVDSPALFFARYGL